MTFTLSGSAAMALASSTSPGQHRIASAPCARSSKSVIAMSDAVRLATKSRAAIASIAGGRRRVTSRTGFGMTCFLW